MILAEFVGSVSNGLSSSEDSYFFKKPKCRAKGGFSANGRDTVLMHIISNLALDEESLRTVLSARLLSHPSCFVEF